MTKKEMLGQMEELRSTCVDICTNLWNNPESGGNEQKSADMIRELLHHEGFVIVNEEHLPHAFYAEYGSGKPVIAVVGGRADNLDGVCEQGIDLVLPICRKPMDLEQALNPQEATTNLICAGEAAARSYDLGRI